MADSIEPRPVAASRSVWKPLLAGGCLGTFLGSGLLLAVLLGMYAFYQKEAVRKMAETKELKPVELRARYDWSLTAMDGTTLDMQSLQGQPIFLHLWRPECVSCVAEIPGINALYEHFQAAGVAFVSIAVEAKDDLGVALGMHDVRFPVYTVAQGELPELFKSFSTPSTYIIDRDGFVVYAHTGAVEWDSPDARAFLDRLAEGG